MDFENLSFVWVKVGQTIAPLHLGWGWVELEMFAKCSEKTGHPLGDSVLEIPWVGKGTEWNSYLAF